MLNYKTNEILAMVSMPQFDPTNMDSALSDEAAGALINRATQGAVIRRLDVQNRDAGLRAGKICPI